MSRTLTIDPVTRIEGHARVEIDIDDAGHVASSRFKVMDFRGFETFLRGMQVEMMPTVTSRICGTCPQSHHLAAARAVDKVFGVTAPPAARALRQALNCASIIHSHAVHFFALAAPDLLLGIDADAKDRNIVALLRSHPEVARAALELRSLGQRVTEVVGGRGTHPVSSVPGGQAAPLGPGRVAALETLAQRGLPLALAVFETARDAILTKRDLLLSLPVETAYLGTVKDGALDLYDGDLRLRLPDGSAIDFSEDEWASHLEESVAPGSYAKSVRYRARDGSAVIFRVGALARLNCADRIDTPLADAELKRFREVGGFPCHQTVMYHYARLIELLHAAEKLAEIAKGPEIRSDVVRVEPKGPPRRAAAHVEAPRGVLFHEYDVDAAGIVTSANLLVATQQNLDALNRTITLSAERYLDQDDETLLNGIEFGIRCYDPCLSCATHRLGDMKLDVVVRRGDTLLRQAIRR